MFLSLFKKRREGQANQSQFSSGGERGKESGGRGWRGGDGMEYRANFRVEKRG